MHQENNPLRADRWIGAVFALMFASMGIALFVWADAKHGISMALVGTLPLAGFARTSQGAGRWAVTSVAAIILSGLFFKY